MRTQEEIDAQIQARREELEREAATRANVKRCDDCAFSSTCWCEHPLVVGHSVLLFKNWDNRYPQSYPTATLCGEEKALWEPIPIKLPLWLRIWNWIKWVWSDDF